MLLRFLKTILSTILWCRPKTTSPKSKGKLFHKLYNTYAEYGAPPGNAFDRKRFYS